MDNKEFSTIGEWYSQLSPFRKFCFDLLCLVVGSGIAIEIGGYRSDVRKQFKEGKES